MNFKQWFVETNLLRVCAWCRRQLNENNDPIGKPLYKPMNAGDVAKFAKINNLPPITHGCCNECMSKMMAGQI